MGNFNLGGCGVAYTAALLGRIRYYFINSHLKIIFEIYFICNLLHNSKRLHNSACLCSYSEVNNQI